MYTTYSYATTTKNKYKYKISCKFTNMNGF